MKYLHPFFSSLLVVGFLSSVQAAEPEAPSAPSAVELPGSEEGGIVLTGGHSQYSISARSTGGFEENSSTRGSSLINGFGAFHTWRLSPQLRIEGGLYYVRKSLTENESGGRTVSDGSLVVQQQLRAVGVAHWLFAEGLSIGVGPYYAYGIGEFEEKSASGRISRSGYKENYWRRGDFGAVIAAQGRIPLTPTLSVVTDIRYFHGLRNVLDEDRLLRDTGLTNEVSISARTRDWQGMVGLALVIPSWLGL